jgi:N-acetylglucosaminyl-diphospho-decaprenol L-rhamnosyltransferase
MPGTENPKFSVVTVNYESWPYTLRLVESLRETGNEELEIVVVDNDQEEAPKLPPGARLTRNLENVGFARACNVGITASEGELVVLLNPDSLVEKGFFEELESFFDRNSRAGVAGPRIVDDEGNLQLSARRELSFVSGLWGRTSLLTQLFPKNPLVRRLFPAAEHPSTPMKVDWVSGACMILRRQMLEEIGAMDERFFMYFEDADLCRRAREAGWHVYYLPQVEVLHHTGASSRSRLRARLKAIYNLHKSAFLYHRKYGPHGPLHLYSLIIATGLCVRAFAKLITLRMNRSK